MGKKDPNDVVDDFKKLADESLVTWQRMCGQLGDTGLKKTASVDAFLNVAVGWESFLSDWHIAAINRDSSAFTAELERWVGKKVQERPGLGPLLSLSIKHPDLALVPGTPRPNRQEHRAMAEGQVDRAGDQGAGQPV